MRRMKLKPQSRMGKAPFHIALVRYGESNFNYRVVDTFSNETDAYAYKELLIDKYNTMNPDYGYNCTTGGNKTFKNAIHVIDRLIVANTGKTMPDSFVQIMKERVGVLHPHFGIKRSKETRENMRQGQLNSDYVQSEETKRQKSETMIMRWQEPEVIERMAKRERGEVTAATRKKLSKANSGKNNAMYGKTGALNPNYGIPMPQWQKDIISKKNKEHHRIKRVKLLKEYSQRTEKKCCTCKDVKPLDMFYKSNTNLDGYAGQCKPCERKRKSERKRRTNK